MAQIFEFGADDLSRGQLYTPGWYRVRITGIEAKMNKKNDGTNVWIKGKIVMEADSGDTKFANCDTPYLWLFSDKAKGIAVGFWKALGVEVGPGVRVDFEATVGRELEMKINNDMWEGQMRNSVPNEYRKVKEERQ
jgi:hypothetical protein